MNKMRILTIGFAVFCASCSREKPRPANVPVDAILIGAPKGAGVWQCCSLDGVGVRCQIFNRSGLVLYDEPFVVYSGRVPSTSAEAKPSEKGGEQWVRLRDGSILIPTSRQEQMRRALDWQFGKRETR